MQVRRFQHDLKTSNPKEFLKNLLFIKSYGRFCKIINWSWDYQEFTIVIQGRQGHKNIDNFITRRDFSKLIADLNSWDRELSYEHHIIFFLHKSEKSI